MAFYMNSPFLNGKDPKSKKTEKKLYRQIDKELNKRRRIAKRKKRKLNK
jgi:hypothetical protein